MLFSINLIKLKKINLKQLEKLIYSGKEWVVLLKTKLGMAGLISRQHLKPLFSSTQTSKKLLQYLSHRMFAARVWSIKYRRKEKLIAQFGGKLRDERFKPN